MDYLIDAEFGEHDYDWLLTPPETPLVPSSDVAVHQTSATLSRGRPTARSTSTTRASRMPTSQSQNFRSSKPARSSSLPRHPISDASSFSSINSNTSTALVTSRSSSTTRNRATTATPSPTSHQLASRSQTPAKSRTTPTPPGVKTAKSHSSRPSTPTSQSPSSTSPSSSVTPSSSRSHSRSSTPARRSTNSSPASAPVRAASVGRVRNPPAASATRPSSPGQPIDTADFPSDPPRNLRTRIPERPASATRARPGGALTPRANLNSQNVVSAGSNNRHSLPIVSHSKFGENLKKDQVQSNKCGANTYQIQRVVSDNGIKTNKVGSATESNGFGRTLSKKSLEMALRHMDIKQKIGGIQRTFIIPHSIYSKALKRITAEHKSDPVVPATTHEARVENGSCPGNNGPASNNGHLVTNGSSQQKPVITRESDFDLFGISRYETILLNEDSNNLNWLHNFEDKSDQSPVFDHRFEPLPEPFGLL